jgi:hypothetical protein
MTRIQNGLEMFAAVVRTFSASGLVRGLAIAGVLMTTQSAFAQKPVAPPGAAEEEDEAIRREAEASRLADEAEAAKAMAVASEFKSDVKPIELSKELKKLTDNLTIDKKNKWVVLDGTVVLRRGPPLEMFACLKNTKEHESIVAIPIKASQVHGALLAIGAKPGTPVVFSPEYKAATGQEIEVRVIWKDKAGKEHQVRAQDWIREIKTKKAMTHPFIFAGSNFYVDEETGKQFYMAEGGELICVSNFSSATMDLPVESSQSTEGLLFEAFTERVPPDETPVRLVLMPKAADKDADKAGDAKKSEEKPAAEKKPEEKKPDAPKAEAPKAE